MFKMFKLLCTYVRKRQCIKYYNKQHLHINSEDSLLNMSVSHLKHFLKQHCLNIIEGYTCIITDCPICSNIKRKSKLYVNKTTGM